MMRLFMVLFAIVSTSLAGTCVVVALVMGANTWPLLLAAAAVGWLVSIPATWVITKKVAAS